MAATQGKLPGLLISAAPAINVKPVSAGVEIAVQRYGPPDSRHPDPWMQRLTQASGQFQIAFGREPQAQDVLLFEDVQFTHSPARNGLHFGRFIEA